MKIVDDFDLIGESLKTGKQSSGYVFTDFTKTHYAKMVVYPNSEITNIVGPLHKV